MVESAFSVSPRPTYDVVIGLGNPLMGDDGLGITALATLRDEWEVPDDLLLVDGGTWGMNLLPTIEGARRVLLLDAIDQGMPAGTQVVLSRDEIPKYLAVKLSPHQIDMREVLALAELRGTLPPETIALGIQPERVELSLALSPTVASHVEALLATVTHQLSLWGHQCVPRQSSDACMS